MASNWQVGKRIKQRWEIHEIKRGGMGVVYIVYDHHWKEILAAKTFQDEIFVRDPVLADRFAKEALTWINLDIHQNVTQARFVENIEGKPFLFLEYANGGDLSDWIGTPRLTQDLSQVLRIAIQFCDGMTHAFSKGVKAHRDVKPRNCLLTQDRILKITDFGLAKVFDDLQSLPASASGHATNSIVGYTRTGSYLGAPEYMAPEQFQNAKRVDVRADVYSFGIMLFEMIAGKLPFDGDSWERLEQMHTSRPLPHIPGVPHNLDEVLKKCLAKDSSDRYADFAAIRASLETIFKEITGQSAPSPPTAQALAAWQLGNKGVSLGKLGKLDDAVACYDQLLQTIPNNAQAWMNKGAALAELKRMPEALAHFDHALNLDPNNAMGWANKASALSAVGRHNDSLECANRSIALTPHFEGAWLVKARTFSMLMQPEKAIACYDQVISLDPRNGEAFARKGTDLILLDRPVESLKCFRKAQKLDYPEAGKLVTHALKILSEQPENQTG